jgi:hypothetical protein
MIDESTQKAIASGIAQGMVEVAKVIQQQPSMAAREREFIREFTGGGQTDVARVFNLTADYEFQPRSTAISPKWRVDMPEMTLPILLLVQENLQSGRWRIVNVFCPDDAKPRAFIVALFRQQRADQIREAELSGDPSRTARVESEIAQDANQALAYNLSLPLMRDLVGKTLGDSARLRVLSSQEGEGPFEALLPCRVLTRNAPTLLFFPALVTSPAPAGGPRTVPRGRTSHVAILRRVW